jgi:hypothetical protein
MDGISVYASLLLGQVSSMSNQRAIRPARIARAQPRNGQYRLSFPGSFPPQFS